MKPLNSSLPRENHSSQQNPHGKVEAVRLENPESRKSNPIPTRNLISSRQLYNGFILTRRETQTGLVDITPIPLRAVIGAESPEGALNLFIRAFPEHRLFLAVAPFPGSGQLGQELPQC